MQNSIWKLTALVGVVGIGFLVVLQAQRGLTRSARESAYEEFVELDEQKQESETEPGESVLLGQSEPFFSDDTEPAVPEKLPSGPQNSEFTSESTTPEPEAMADNFSVPGNTARGLDFRESLPAKDGTASPKSTKTDLADVPLSSPKDANPFDPFDNSPATVAGNAPNSSETTSETNSPSGGEVVTAGYDEPASDAAADSDVSKSEPQPATNGPRLLLAPGSSESPASAKKAGGEAKTVNFDPFDSEAQTKSASPAAPTESDFGTPNANQSASPARSSVPQPLPFPTEANPATPSPSPVSKAFGLSPQKTSAEPALNPFAEPEPRETSPEKKASSLSPTQSPKDAKSLAPTPVKSFETSTEPAESSKSPKPFELDLGSSGDDVPTPKPTEKTDTPKSAVIEEPARLGPVLDADKAPSQLQPKGLQPKGDGILQKDTPHGEQQPQLKIEKVAPKNAVLGQPMVYSIVVKNSGKSRAQQVVVEDTVPKGVKLTGTIPQARLSGSRLSWKIGTLEPNETREIKIRVIPQQVGQIGSVATVNFVSEIAAETLITAPDLQLSFTAQPKAKLGEPVVFHFKVTNKGSSDAQGVMIRDLVPKGLKHPGGNDLEFEVGTLAVGDSREVHLTLTAAEVGEVVNQAIVLADGGVEIKKQAAVNITKSQGIVISRTGPKQRFIGRPTVFKNTVTNETDTAVPGVTILETIPEGMEFVAATNGGQYNEAKHSIAWSIAQLGPKESKTVEVRLIPRQSGTLASFVTALATDGSRAETNSETVVRGFVAVGLEIPAVDSPVEVNGEVTLRVIAKNRGTTAASNVTIKLVIPREVKVGSIKAPTQSTTADDTIQFEPIKSLEPGKSMTFDIVLKAVAPGDIRVQVQIEADQMKRPLRREEALLILPPQ